MEIFLGFLRLRVSERDGTRSHMGLNDAYYWEESFKLCLGTAPHRKDDKTAYAKFENHQYQKSVGVIKNLNENSKSSSNFASKGI